ncbi:elongation Factor 1-alpha EF1-alpha [Hokovirus HKV1]|uniref:Elongation Factor 1-alpha EF1-alpha n=1 Tax=Hokovirus HKV1 TaxID=1977638 RepID=A0A1V0SGC3_9VIRU|nr:elongation Factor 1-alpha EF1-alpha [Hokovirus HKV1]
MSKTNQQKEHISIAITGHVDSGKSTFCGRLMFDMGGLPERELEKLKQEARALGKESFVFAFFTDKQKEERARGITISCTTKDFYSNNYHFTIIDAPGHKDFVKNMISGSSAADVAILMAPADNFAIATAKGNHKNGEIEGQTRQHSLLLNLLGVKQLIVCVNKMDSINYDQARFEEIRDEIRHMLLQTGWQKPFIMNSVPIMPISAWQGDNLLTQSTNMPWWTGVDVETINKQMVHVNCLMDVLDNHIQVPVRFPNNPLRMPVSGVLKIPGIGDVITGRIEQGTLKPKDKIVFLPTHTKARPCEGTVFSIEMHHTSQDIANPGDNVGLNIKGLSKDYLPKSGDIMTLANDATVKVAKKITAQVKVLSHPGEIKVGYTPIVYIRTNKAPMRLLSINWKMGKDTGNQKVDTGITCLKTGDMAEIVVEPQKPIVADEFRNCEGLGRLAFMDSQNVVMLGKIVGISSD